VKQEYYGIRREDFYPASRKKTAISFQPAHTVTPQLTISFRRKAIQSFFKE
jgi:hypothetical protein